MLKICAAAFAIIIATSFGFENSAQAAGSSSSSSSSGTTANVMVSPLGLILGELYVSADFPVYDSIAVGPDGSYWSLTFDDVTVNAFEVGGHIRYYFGRPAITEGWQLEGRLAYASATVKETTGGLNYSGTGTGESLEVLGIYQWIWPSGFNITLGLGIGTSSVQNVTVTDNQGDTTTVGSHTEGGLASEFNLGWLF